MTSFDDRKDAYENKFAHDAELQFKADARCNKMLGEWAAALLGKTGAEATDYIRTVVTADFEEAGHEDVYRKLAGDLDGKADETTIRAKMAECMAEARRQVLAES
ncbi:aldolase [Thioclava dalianensis]|uniref:Aldolase n=1 Tax=Thioclava dalianensis TaxID=1185766 RepID=A0A074TD16_9RHOB|nr:DUF1476 domain-containing protein [Thioclava dalianensis]KEP69594.1 aldolase [Thioclava dalianensis]SFN15213.1 hypothetical protein SAMN05216224_102673 [Thioclava dalianensis]